MNRDKIRLGIWIVVLFAASLVMLIPVLKPGFLVTDDAGWMVVRLSAFYQSLREGQFPVRFLGRLNQSYGYPVANFLYPGYLYIGSILHFFGLSFQGSVETIIVLSVIIGGLALFFWLRHFFDDAASGLGALSFVFAPYLLYDVYKRGSVGEILAMCLTALCLSIIESKYTWLLSFAIGFLSISHNTLALFFLPIIFIYLIIRGRRQCFLYYFLGMGMSLFFWFPAFTEQKYVIFNRSVVSNPFDYFQTSGIIAIFSLPFVAAAIFSFTQKQMKMNKIRYFFLFLCILAYFFATPVSALAWKNRFFTMFIQFPYRWFSFLCIVGPWFVAQIAGKRNAYRVISMVILCIFFLLSFQYAKVESVIRVEGFYTTNEATTTVADEYLPHWAGKKPEVRAIKRLEFYSGGGTIGEKKVTSQKIDAVVNASEKSIIQVNMLYYPGWGAMIDDKKAEIVKKDPYGFMQIPVPAGRHRLYMEFRETPERFVVDCVSLICLIVALALPFLQKANKKKI